MPTLEKGSSKMFRIGVKDGNSWTLMGVRLILDQLGIQYETSKENNGFDLYISNKDESIDRNNYLIIIEENYSEPTKKGCFLEYNGFSAFFPEKFTEKSKEDNVLELALMDNKWPGIIQKSKKICVIPNFFKYISQISILRKFNKTFAESFSWDSFRTIFLHLIEYVALCSSKTLLRIWFYPSYTYNNSITFTTDIDHKLSWEIIKGIEKNSKFISMCTRLVPGKVQKLMALLVAKNYYSLKRYKRMIKSKWLLPLETLYKVKINLTVCAYFASITEIYAKNIPITAFLRSSKFQKEETKEKDFPYGTGKDGYKAHALNHVDIGLHFGATIGKTTMGNFVNNPYCEDVFGYDILTQVLLLGKEIDQRVKGTRLHHIYGFNQKMFNFINESGVMYDSSIFGCVQEVDTRYSPNGCTIPYYPILSLKTGEIKKAEFIEIPVCGYETDKLLFNFFNLHSSSIVVSQHPDRIKSNMIKNILRNFKIKKNAWWPVSLSELASWLIKRNNLKLDIFNDTINIMIEHESPERFCVVIYPAKQKFKLKKGFRKVSEVVNNHRHFIDVSLQKNFIKKPSR